MVKDKILLNSKIDFDSLEKNTVTVRNRDTMEQKTIALDDLNKYFIDFFSDAKS